MLTNPSFGVEPRGGGALDHDETGFELMLPRYGRAEHIQLRQIAHFTCADPAYGPGVAELSASHPNCRAADSGVRWSRLNQCLTNPS
jgi:hypothetical protein